MHDALTIDETTGEQRKPEIITFYNSTKGGVDTCDQLCSLYSVSRKSRRWPLVIFFCLLNTVGINAQVIHASNHNFERRIIRRNFLEEIGLSLVRPFMQIRVQTLTLPRELRSSIKKFLPEEDVVAPRERPPARGRCNFCPRVQDRKTPFICEECYKYVCKEHMKVVCDDCV
uniref:PiggyBac transposable element-derived protein domain-containing protein n=1 Tax=Cuerna arida TaxID=1464854 RepID=A0A1B6FAD5_9HEMI